jgi:hypothetical protein
MTIFCRAMEIFCPILKLLYFQITAKFFSRDLTLLDPKRHVD